MSNRIQPGCHHPSSLEERWYGKCPAWVTVCQWWLRESIGDNSHRFRVNMAKSTQWRRNRTNPRRWEATGDKEEHHRRSLATSAASTTSWTLWRFSSRRSRRCIASSRAPGLQRIKFMPTECLNEVHTEHISNANVDINYSTEINQILNLSNITLEFNSTSYTIDKKMFVSLKSPLVSSTKGIFWWMTVLDLR